jgi:quercetin dioxygenase-like cupin family protein
MKRLLAAIGVALVPLGALSALTFASPAQDVTPTFVARSTFESFNVRSDPHGPVDFRAHASRPMDVFVRQHDYKPGGFTGWHTHPGPIFLQVKSGELVVYDYANPCEGIKLTPGKGYVDTGRGHMVVNESDAPATDISVIMAPANNGPFRGELDPPDVDCDA